MREHGWHVKCVVCELGWVGGKLCEGELVSDVKCVNGMGVKIKRVVREGGWMGSKVCCV